VPAYDAADRGYSVVEAPLDGSGLRDVIATSRSEVAPTSPTPLIEAARPRYGFVTAPMDRNA
jgi:hypothetical protein